MIVDPTNSELLRALAKKVDEGDGFAQVALNHKPVVAPIAQLAEAMGWRVVSVWHQSTTSESVHMLDCTYILLRYEAP